MIIKTKFNILTKILSYFSIFEFPVNLCPKPVFLNRWAARLFDFDKKDHFRHKYHENQHF